MLIAEGIQKSYGALPVLKGVSLKVEKGEVVAIVGASGAGKSTLLHILGTLDKPDAGSVKIDDNNIFSNGMDLPKFRNKNIGFVFQFHNLLPEFSAVENVMIPALIAGTHEKQARDRAIELLELLGLKDRANHKPSEMSGGEQQRTAVARALINSPSLVFADEPSGNLDSQNASDLHQLFFKLKKELGHTFVIVTHNKEFADMADRKLMMKDGVII
ncbi:MAG: ABC transporter ATP-binding protein [Cyclobacteriaceae bacterium]|nr:ABC transporter ATP-binding protein [Cyclobacteriaceae bacterium]